MAEPEKKEQIPIAHTQRVVILIDANNIERGIADRYGKGKMLNYDFFIPKVLRGRGLNNFCYFIEGGGHGISEKFMVRLAKKYFGDVIACFKSADVPLAMHAAILMGSVDTYIIFSGDSDYIDCVSILKAHGKRVEIVGVEGSVSGRLVDMVHDCTYILKDDLWEDPYRIKPKKVEVKPEVKPEVKLESKIEPPIEIKKDEEKAVQPEAPKEEA